MQDTPIFDKAVYEFINDNIDSTELNNRFLRCEKFLEYLDDQENAELEIIQKITINKALKYSFIYYIKEQYNKDKTFIIDTFERKKRLFGNVSTYTENLTLNESESEKTLNVLEKNEKSDKLDPITLLKQAFNMAVSEDGWALLSAVGLYLSKLDPGFDPRTYGFKQLLQLIKAYPGIFEFKEYQPKLGPPIFSIIIKE